ncbi:unnamed protein product [Camellia sinensis]
MGLTNHLELEKHKAPKGKGLEGNNILNIKGFIDNQTLPFNRSSMDSGFCFIAGKQGDGDRKSWASFQERIARAPEQVLRYYRRAKPLWPIYSGRPSETDITKCSYCGGPRGFEFQILPQLLYYFGVENDVNSLDWATIVVCACEASCEGTGAYKEEFGWAQLASQSAPVP